MTAGPVLAVGGTVQASGGLYLPRRADDELLDACLRGQFAYILTSRQMGKSSLMIHAMERLAAKNIRAVFIDLNELGNDVSAEQWYKGLLTIIAEQLRLNTAVLPWWNTHSDFGIAQRFFQFLQEVVVADVAEPIVIFVDEIDTTLRLTFTDDFFAGIRYCFNARARHPELQRLSFVLSGVASPSDLIKESDRTPFNIGHRIELGDFPIDEALPLVAAFHMAAEGGRRTLEAVLAWTGGHPYLTVNVVRALAASPTPADVDAQVTQLFFGPLGERDSNISLVSDMLTKDAPDEQKEATLRLYRDIRSGKAVRDEELSQVASWLRLAGVVRRDAGLLRVRNPIYERIFDTVWVDRHLPLYIDWRRRLTGALRRVAIFSAIPLVLLSAFAIWKWDVAIQQTEIANKETQKANQSATSLRDNLNRATAFIDNLGGVVSRVQDQDVREQLIAQLKDFNVNVEQQKQALAGQPLDPQATELTKLKADKDALKREIEALRDSSNSSNVPPSNDANTLLAGAQQTINQLQRTLSESDKKHADEIQQKQNQIDDLQARLANLTATPPLRNSETEPESIPVLPKTARLFVYRPGNLMDSFATPTILCDGNKLADLRKSVFFQTEVGVGQHQCEATLGRFSTSIRVNAEAGKDYFVSYSGTSTGRGALVSEERQQAVEAIRRLKPIAKGQIFDPSRVSPSRPETRQ